MPDEQWEYCRIVGNQVFFLGETTTQHQAPQDQQGRASTDAAWHDLGKAGREFVSVVAPPQGVGAKYYFKRQVQPDRAVNDAAKTWYP